MLIPETGSYHDFKCAVLALPYTKAEEIVEDERGVLDTGRGLGWYPFRAGTLRGTVGCFRVYDDVDDNGIYPRGVLRTSANLIARINYSTGQFYDIQRRYRRLEYCLSYFYDLEAAHPVIPRHIQLILTSFGR